LYFLDLKGNQGILNEDVRLFLEAEFNKNASTAIVDSYEEADKGMAALKCANAL